MTDLDAFLRMPTSEVADIVREIGPRVCVFPINGTRRWFALEYPEKAADDYVRAYLDISGKRHIKLYQAFFDHGIETLLTPIVGPDILERGNAYQPLLAQGLSWFATNDDFRAFYRDYDVRVRIYGDADRYLGDSAYAGALDAYEKLTEATAPHSRYRLFFGICAHDATESVAEIGAKIYEQTGRYPSKREIIEAYYGEYVEPVDLFIGFDRPAAFDMPLIATGSEDLYFTVAPSPYLDAKALRLILYDHIFSRRVDDSAYETLSPEDWQTLAAFYRKNRHHILGLGKRHQTGNYWYPLPQIDLPSEMETELAELTDNQADTTK
jgi:tuberculosinol/isotuberculosinol synthase